MKAIVASRYGSADTLRVDEVSAPEPAHGELLVRVHAASVNALDWRMMRARPFFIRFGRGLFRPRHTGLGADFSGVVERVGSSQTGFEVGDAVFGCLEGRTGTFAEYVVVPATEAVTHKPATISHADAAACPIAASTAIYGLQDKGLLRPGQTVLVNGATGSVGSFTVQLAKRLGARSVAAVCSTAKVELVASLGADRVFDYTREDFTRSGERYDLVIDVVGNRTTAELERVVADGGRCVMLGFKTIRGLLGHSIGSGRVNRSGRATFVPPASPTVDRAMMDRIRRLLEEGILRPVIERVYPLAEAPDAIGYVDRGHARSKVVIEVVTADGV